MLLLLLLGSYDTLLQKLSQKQYVAARAEAQETLQHDPLSPEANWAMAIVHDEAEGNYARALYYLERAEQAASGDMRRKILHEKFYTLMYMNRNEDALQVVEANSEVLPAVERIWPMFKANRVEEAQAIGLEASKSSDWQTRVTAYNGLMSIRFEQSDRTGSYDYAVQGIEATQGRSCILYRNGAGAAFVRFHYEKSEEYGLAAAKAVYDDCGGSRGWDQLAGLYLVEAEYQKALSALRSLNQEPIPPRVRPQFAMSRRAILALLLHVLGKTDEALRMSAELYSLPQRVGMVSGTEDNERFLRVSQYFATLRAHTLRQREQRSYQAWWSLPSLAPVRSAVTQWQLERELLQLLTRRRALASVVRPNLQTAFEWPAWATLDLAEVTGGGVLRKAIAEARVDDSAYPEASAYFNAYEGELAYRAGDLEEADRLAAQALRGLSPYEALLRLRTQAWHADAKARMGHVDAQAYREVLERFPAILRILDLRVPVTVGSDGSEPAQRAASRLESSRRFGISDDAPFRLAASTHGDKVEICLRDDSNMTIVCADGDNVTQALDAFHSACFSPRIGLNQLDLNSLDGSPGKATTDEALKGLLP